MKNFAYFLTGLLLTTVSGFSSTEVPQEHEGHMFNNKHQSSPIRGAQQVAPIQEEINWAEYQTEDDFYFKGSQYLNLGTEIGRELAREVYKKGSDCGYASSMAMYADFFDINSDERYQYIIRAARLGDSDSECFVLGIDPKILEQSEEDGIKNLRKALEKLENISE